MIPAGARVWIAMGQTDMRKGMQGLALLVQQGLKRDPHGGDLFVVPGPRRFAGEDHLARRDWHVALRQAAREGPVRMAFGEGRDGLADGLSTGLPAGRDRLA